MSVTLNGNTYSSADFAGFSYVAAIEAMAADWLVDAGRSLGTTSATSNDVGTGSKSFTMAAAVPFGVGADVKVAQTSAPTTNAMWGTVTARSGTSLTISVSVGATIGSGTSITDWTISAAGRQGATGAAGNDGTDPDYGPADDAEELLAISYAINS